MTESGNDQRAGSLNNYRKVGVVIIALGTVLVIVGLGLLFTTSLFDSLLPTRSTNQRVMAIVAIWPIAAGFGSLFTGVAGTPNGASARKSVNPGQFLQLVLLGIGVGVVMMVMALLG
jgi:hypothetical protein